MKTLEVILDFYDVMPSERYDIMLCTDRHDVYTKDSINFYNPMSVGFDLYGENKTVFPRHVSLVGSHIKTYSQLPYYFALVARSSLHKHGLMLANHYGVIDPDYRGEVKMALYNFTDSVVETISGQRYCQLVITTYIPHTTSIIKLPEQNIIKIAFITSTAVYTDWHNILKTERSYYGFGHSDE